MSDDTSGRRGPEVVYTPGSLADDVDLLAIVRRYERFATDVDQRLKDIELLLRQDRRDTDERIDQIEQDVASVAAKLSNRKKK